jgi:hypothetical protein
VRGRVVSPDGKPLPDIRISGGYLRDDTEVYETLAPLDITTDLEGRFEYRGPTGAPIHLTLTPEGGKPVPLVIPSKGKDPEDLGDITLALPGRLVVEVVSNPDPDPIAAFGIMLDMNKFDNRQVIDAQKKPIAYTGRVEFSSVLPGWRTVTLTRWTDNPHFVDSRMANTKTVLIEAGKTATVTLGDGTGSIRGRLLHRNPSAEFTLQGGLNGYYDSAPEGLRIVVKPGQEFTYSGLTPGNWELVAYIRGGGTLVDRGFKRVVVKDGQETAVEITVAAGTIQGRVVDPEGRAIKDLTVVLKSEINQRNGGTHTVADGNGGFRFVAVPPGTYSLSAQHPVHGRVRLENVALKEDGTELRGLELKLAQGGARLRVRIADKVTGKAVNDAEVMALPPGGGVYLQHPELQGDGSVLFRNLEKGEYEVLVSAAGYLASYSKVTVGSELEALSEVRLVRPATLTWRVTIPPEVSLKGLRFFVQDSNGGMTSQGSSDPTLREVTVEAKALFPGKAMLGIVRDKDLVHKEETEIRAGQTHDVETRFQP